MLVSQNPPDMFLLFKAHWKVEDGSDSVSCWQGNEFLDQVLFLCRTHDDKTSARCYIYTGHHPEYRSRCTHPQGLSDIRHRLLPFSISFLMASSVKACWAGSALGNMLTLLIVIPLHLMVMLPGQTRGFCCSVIVTDLPLSLIFNCKLTKLLGNTEAGWQSWRINITPAAHTFKHFTVTAWIRSL